MKVIYRFLSILIAYFAATLSASVVAFGSVYILSWITDPRFIFSFADDAIWLGVLAALIVVGAAPPAIVAIIAAELLRVRRAIVYALGGIFVGTSLLLYGSWSSPHFFYGPKTITAGLVTALLTGSAVGGFVYWLIAGRRAGMWKEFPPRA